jgi:15-cis-phytoene synthase
MAHEDFVNISILPYMLPLQIGGYASRRHSNLALALILLPKDRRADAFLFYDFCRAVDDLADSATETPECRKKQLAAWVQALQPGNEAQLPADFAEMIQRRQLDRQLLEEIVLGMQMDTEQCRYPTFSELRRYCWRAASAVGLASAALFGSSGDAVKDYSTELGLALQLTNILRDVREDAAMNRIYIPQEDLERFGVTEQDILNSTPSPQMIHLLNHQAERADSHFAKAELAWSEMSANQRRLMRPARLMSAIYRDLLLQMHQDRYDVFQKIYRVSRWKKLLLALRVVSGK